MAITAGRRRTRHKVIIRTVIKRPDLGPGWIEYTATAVNDSDEDKIGQDLGEVPAEGYKSFEEYKADTKTLSVHGVTLQDNRYVVGEEFFNDLRPTR